MPALPAPGSAVLAGDAGRHAARVLRLRAGEDLELVDGTGGRAPARVAGEAADGLRLTVGAAVHEPAPAVRRVLVQALAKGERGELAVELAVECGVDEIVPWAAERSVVRWQGERGERSRRRWQVTADAAAQQSRRAWWPTVSPVATTAEVAGRLARGTGVVLHESAVARLVDVVPEDGELVVVVGPEGGISAGELTALGGAPYRLGPHVLRTSTAGGVALAVLAALAERRAG